MAAGDDGVEQQLIQQLDALIDEGPDDELAAARGRRTLMDELLRKSPRVAPEGGGALLFNASPRVAPSEGAAPLTSSPRVKPLWRSEHLRASRPTVGAHSCSTRHPGSRRQACRKARRQCRPSSCRELHRAWHLAMAEARFCSTPRQGSRRKGLLFGLRRRSPKGPRRALRRLAEARFCSTRVRELPRMGFLFSLRHHAPRRASRR